MRACGRPGNPPGLRQATATPFSSGSAFHEADRGGGRGTHNNSLGKLLITSQGKRTRAGRVETWARGRSGRSLLGIALDRAREEARERTSRTPKAPPAQLTRSATCPRRHCGLSADTTRRILFPETDREEEIRPLTCVIY